MNITEKTILQVSTISFNFKFGIYAFLSLIFLNSSLLSPLAANKARLKNLIKRKAQGTKFKIEKKYKYLQNGFPNIIFRLDELMTLEH